MSSRTDALPAPSPPQIVHHHLRGLDGMRGLAFLAVFTFHYAKSSHVAHGPVHLLLLACSGGWMGVDLFFVLSGFLITGILLDTREHPLYFRNFYARRALRIFPLFYGVFLLLLLLTPLLHLEWRPGHLLYPLYLGNIAGAYDFTLNSVRPFAYLTPLWSLAVEEQFYLLWPMVILAVRTPRALLRTCGALLVLNLALRTVLFLHLGIGSWEWSYMLLPMRSDALLAGAVCAILFRRHSLPDLLRRSRVPFFLSGALLLGIFALLHEPNYHHALFTLVGYPLLATFCAGLLLRFAAPAHPLGKLGSSRFLRFFGTYSYGMYVFHELFIPAQEPVLRWLQKCLHSVAAGAATYFALCLVVVSLVAVLSFRFFEQPWLRMKRFFPYHVVDPQVEAQTRLA